MKDWGGLIALALAWVSYLVGANVVREWRRARANHSPITVALVLSWISLQASRDPDPDTDTEPAPTGKRGKRYVQVSDTETRIEYFDLDKDSLPLAMPSQGRAESQLHRWIRRSFEEGAKYSDVVRDGKRMFGKSEATIKRAINQVRKRPESAS